MLRPRLLKNHQQQQYLLFLLCQQRSYHSIRTRKRKLLYGANNKRRTVRDVQRLLVDQNLLRKRSIFRNTATMDAYVTTAKTKLVWARNQLYEYWNPSYTSSNNSINNSAAAASARPLNNQIVMDVRWRLWNYALHMVPAAWIVVYCEVWGNYYVWEWNSRNQLTTAKQSLGDEYVQEHVLELIPPMPVSMFWRIQYLFHYCLEAVGLEDNDQGRDEYGMIHPFLTREQRRHQIQQKQHSSTTLLHRLELLYQDIVKYVREQYDEETSKVDEISSSDGGINPFHQRTSRSDESSNSKAIQSSTAPAIITTMKTTTDQSQLTEHRATAVSSVDADAETKPTPVESANTITNKPTTTLPLTNSTSNNEELIKHLLKRIDNLEQKMEQKNEETRLAQYYSDRSKQHQRQQQNPSLHNQQVDDDASWLDSLLNPFRPLPETNEDGSPSYTNILGNHVKQRMQRAKESVLKMITMNESESDAPSATQDRPLQAADEQATLKTSQFVKGAAEHETSPQQTATNEPKTEPVPSDTRLCEQSVTEQESRQQGATRVSMITKLLRFAGFN